MTNDTPLTNAVLFDCGNEADPTPYPHSNGDWVQADHARLLERHRATLRSALQGVIEGCVHPDQAIRAVMVDLRPVRDALASTDLSVTERQM